MIKRKGLAKSLTKGKGKANLAAPNTYFNRAGGNKALTSAKSGTKKPKRVKKRSY